MLKKKKSDEVSSGASVVAQTSLPVAASKARTFAAASSVKTMPPATIGVAVIAESDDVPTPISAVQATLKLTGASVLPTTFSDVPPGSGHDPT